MPYSTSCDQEQLINELKEPILSYVTWFKHIDDIDFVTREVLVSTEKKYVGERKRETKTDIFCGMLLGKNKQKKYEYDGMYVNKITGAYSWSGSVNNVVLSSIYLVSTYVRLAKPFQCYVFLVIMSPEKYNEAK